MDKIADNVFITSLVSAREYLQDKDPEETVAVLSVGDFMKPDWKKYQNVTHLHLGGLADNDSKRFAAILPEAVNFIAKNKDKDKVIVHCWAGKNRSASTIIGWLILKKGKSFDTALSTVEGKHPEANPWEELQGVLKAL